MITKLSPAKINLTLDVKPKRPGADFHELETVYHLLDWGDELTVETSDIFELHGDFDCAVEDNLIYRAWELIPEKKPVCVTVEKQIPSGAGLGGGSSNAATFVQVYYESFGLGAAPGELITALGELGKDIPFFMGGRPCAHGTHYGEVIKPLDLDFSGTPIWIYLPNFKHSTAWAYSALEKFSTNYTQSLLHSGVLSDCGNTFDQLFYTKNYAFLSPFLKGEAVALAKAEGLNPPNSLYQGRTKHMQICGSGSAFFSWEKLDVPGCRVIEKKFL